MKPLASLIILLFCITHAQASDGNSIIDTLDWQIKKESHDIEVYSSKVPNSNHRAVLSVAIIDSLPQQIVKLLQDTSTCTQWVYQCKSSSLYQSISDKESYIHTSINMPFPVNNRDILAHIQWEENTAKNMITATSMATTGILNPLKNYTRIEKATMIWEITQLGNGKTQIRNYGHIDPAGAIPTWLSNQLSIKAPFETLLGLKKLLEQQE